MAHPVALLKLQLLSSGPDHRESEWEEVRGILVRGEDVEQTPAIITGFHGTKNVMQNAIYINPTRKWAAGAIASSVNDLVKWDQALRTDKLLKRATREQMRTPAVLSTGEKTSYGFGNELRNLRGHQIAGHQGGGMAFDCTLYRFVDDNLTVIVLCNLIPPAG